MNCPHCNEQIPDEALFCPHCGKAVSDIKADETASAGVFQAEETATAGSFRTEETATAGIAAGSYSNNPYPEPEYRDQYRNNSAGDMQVPPGYYEPVQINPPENRQIPPAYNVQSQYTRSQNPYKQAPPISPEKPKNHVAPIIIALLTCIAAIGLVFVIVFRPGPFNRTSDPNNHSESGSADYGNKTYTPTPSATPIPTATPTIAPTPTPTIVPTPTPTTVPEAPSSGGSSGSMISLPGGGQAPASDFIFPNSSTELLSSGDLNSHLSSAYDAQMAINEIYARYGYTFVTNSETANASRSKFGSKDWYIQAQSTCPTANRDNFAESYMNSVERANIETLLAWKDSH